MFNSFYRQSPTQKQQKHNKFGGREAPETLVTPQNFLLVCEQC